MQVVEAGPYQVGDVLGFSGASVVSRVIKLATVPPWWWFRADWHNVSHVEVCCQWNGEIVTVGSTTQESEPCLVTGKPIAGVQAHRPWTKVRDYPGCVFRMRLNDHWSFMPDEAHAFSTDVLRYIGTPYDTLGAIQSVFPDWVTDYNPRREFCSKVVYAQLMRAERLPLDNPNRFSPARLMGLSRYIGTYDLPVRLK